MVRLFQSHAVALDGAYHFLDSLVLGNDVRFEFLCHTFQSDAFLLGYALNGNTSHHRDDISHLIGSDGLTYVYLTAQPLLIQFLQFALQLCLAVTESCSQLKILVADGQGFLFLDVLQLFFLLADFRWDAGILKVYP